MAELNPRPELIPANLGGLSIDSIKIFDEAATLSHNSNCRSNSPEMLAECSISVPNFQEYYLFLALYISKINRRTKSSIKKRHYKRS